MPKYLIQPKSGARGFRVTAKNAGIAALKGMRKRRKKIGVGKGFRVIKVR